MPLDIVGVREVAEMLDVSRQRVDQLLRAGTLPRPDVVLEGGVRIWERKRIVAWIAARPERPTR